MTNNTNTLNGALQELGETMADNLTTQGVTASASDGLTTLANKILDIQGSDVDITLTSSTSVIISGGSVTLSATLLFDNYPIPNATITFTDGSTTLGTSTTNNNGVATYTTTSISNGNVSASCGDISDTTTITILPDNHIEIEYTGSSFSSYKNNPLTYTGRVLVDWGDNNISEYTGSYLTHNYSSSGDYTIKIYGNITALNNYAFYNRSGITSITLPETVVSVGANTFLRASGLVSLYVPESLTSFGEACFYESGITDFYFKWGTANKIVAYDLNWIWGTLNSPIFHIPQGTTSLYVAKDYPSSKLVEEIPYDGIVLSAEKPILSFKDNDKTDLYAQLQLNGVDVAVSGVTVTFKVGSTVLGTAQTDSTGLATLTEGYTSQGIGDVSLTASDGSLLSEIFVEDLPYYAGSMSKIKNSFITDTTTASGRTIYLSPFTFNSDVELEFKLKNIPNNWLVGFGSNGTTVNNKGVWFKLQNYNQNKASIMYVDTGGSAHDVGITTSYDASTVFTIKSEDIHKIYWYLNNTVQAYRDTQTSLPLGLRVDIFDNQDYDIDYIKVKPL